MSWCSVELLVQSKNKSVVPGPDKAGNCELHLIDLGVRWRFHQSKRHAYIQIHVTSSFQYTSSPGRSGNRSIAAETSKSYHVQNVSIISTNFPTSSLKLFLRFHQNAMKTGITLWFVSRARLIGSRHYHYSPEKNQISPNANYSWLHYDLILQNFNHCPFSWKRFTSIN